MRGLTVAMATTIAFLTTPAPVYGASIAYEPFDGPVGPLNGSGGGSGFSGTWSGSSSASVVAGSLVSPTGTLLTSGNRTEVTANADEFLNNDRSLSSTIGVDGTTVWVSFLIRKTQASDANDYGGITVGSLFIGDPGINNNWVLETAGGGGLFDTGIPATVGSTFFLVARMNFFPGDDQVYLWVNPTPGLSAPDIPIDANKDDLDFSTTVLSLGYGSFGTGATTTSYQIDEIRFGNTYLQVAPIPEPSYSELLGVVGAVGLLGWRSRRRACANA